MQNVEDLISKKSYSEAIKSCLEDKNKGLCMILRKICDEMKKEVLIICEQPDIVIDTIKSIYKGEKYFFTSRKSSINPKIYICIDMDCPELTEPNVHRISSDLSGQFYQEILNIINE